MRRGCISLGNIKCDECHRTILYPELYLTLEVARGQNQSICMDCCQKKGLVKSESEGKEEESLFNLSSD